RPHGAAPLRRPHAPLQADPLLPRRRVGAVRPGEGPRRAPERLRRGRLPRGGQGPQGRADPPAQTVQGRHVQGAARAKEEELTTEAQRTQRKTTQRREEVLECGVETPHSKTLLSSLPF